MHLPVDFQVYVQYVPFYLLFFWYAATVLLCGHF